MRKVSISILVLFFCLCALAQAAHAMEGFYVLDGATIEMRPATDPAQPSENKEGYTWLTDSEGNKRLVSDKAVIDSSDIRVVSIKKGRLSPGYRLTIYFKPSSWDKVRDVTSHLVQERLGIFLNGKLFNAPMVKEALEFSASINGLGENELNIFKKGLKATSEFDETKLEQERVQMLRERMIKYPSEYDPFTLFQYYTSDQWLECDRAAAVLEQLTANSPKQSRTLPAPLSDCYAKRGEYAKALSSLEKARPYLEERAFLSIRGDIFSRQGEKEKAIKDFSRVLDLWKNYEPSPKEAEYFERTKGATIKYYEERIQELRESPE